MRVGQAQHGGECGQRGAGSLPVGGVFPSEAGDVVLIERGDIGSDRGQVAASREYGQGLKPRHRAGDGWRWGDVWLRRVAFGEPCEVLLTA